MTWSIHPIADFNAHAAQWDELQERVAGLPFLESAFLLPLLKSFGTGREWLVLEANEQGLQAAAILSRDGKGRWSTFQPSQLPLGPLLCARGRDLEALAAELLAALPGLALAVGFTQIDSALHQRPVDSVRLRCQDYIETGWVDIAGDFDAYWEARGKNLRQNTRKQAKKLESMGLDVRFELLREPEQVAQALADYGRLEAAGWKGDNGTAIAPGHPQYDFFRSMLESFCAKGRAWIYQYRFNDEVVAMDLCISAGRQLVILKTAYDEAHKAVSPSTLMRVEQFRGLFEGGAFDRIEFFGRMMEWHTRWTEQTRPIYHATLYRWSWLPTLKRMLSRGAGK